MVCRGLQMLIMFSVAVVQSAVENDTAMEQHCLSPDCSQFTSSARGMYLLQFVQMCF